MKTHSFRQHQKFHLPAAFLLLWLAILLTSIGVTSWPILLYAAAPCYFAASVLIIARWFRKRSDKKKLDHISGTGWF